jgi:hypothetical protein
MPILEESSTSFRPSQAALLTTKMLCWSRLVSHVAGRWTPFLCDGPRSLGKPSPSPQSAPSEPASFRVNLPADWRCCGDEKRANLWRACHLDWAGWTVDTLEWTGRFVHDSTRCHVGLGWGWRRGWG